MSRSSSGKRFDVFEFAEEDEQVEKASQRFLGMFGNPKKPNPKPKPKPPSPLSKYTFLQCCKSSQHKHSLYQVCLFVITLFVLLLLNVEKLCALWRVMTKYNFAEFCDHCGKCDIEFVYVLVLNLC